MRLLPLLFALSGGAANDVLRELARRTGCPLEITWYPRAPTRRWRR